MITPQFTPGPWERLIGQDTVWSKDSGFILARTEYHRKEMAVNEDEANGNLIVSAPELYGCLKELLECAEAADTFTSDEVDLFARCHAVLAKVGGQSS